MAYDPRFLDFSRWAALVSASLIPFGFTPTQPDEEEWQGWALAIRNVPALAALNVPRPDGFPDWQSWGFRLNETLFQLGL